tara:strand:- start:251 stop:445 length:195 start_codon:yes stop_codon:yes gene_type:complete
MLRRKGKFKSYLITNIPEDDWLKFKKWTAIEGYGTLNNALSELIKLAGNNDLHGKHRTDNEQRT